MEMMCLIKKYNLALFFLCFTISIFAQNPKKDKKNEEENLTMEDDTTYTPNLEYKLEEEKLKIEQIEKQNKKKKKKGKKSVYFGIKARSAVVNKDNGIVEVFRYIDASYLMKNSYLREVYYYDTKNNRIKSETFNDISAKIKKGQTILLLHGLYQEYREGELREEGYYYKGTKHDQWQEFDREGILLEKAKYDLGFSADSKITYYDAAETKIKEVIPIIHNRKQGTYLFFYENGVLGIEGKYENNEKIGLWREFYENRQRKRDTQYTLIWHDAKEPKLLREWDDKGKLTFDESKGGKLKN